MPMIAAGPPMNTLSLETDPRRPTSSRWLLLPASLSDIVPPSTPQPSPHPTREASLPAALVTPFQLLLNDNHTARRFRTEVTIACRTLATYLTGTRVRYASGNRTVSLIRFRVLAVPKRALR